MNGKYIFYGLHAKIKYSFKYFFYIRKKNVLFQILNKYFFYI